MIFNMVRKGTAQPYVPPTWGGGTDAEIVEALQKHYSGAVDLSDYWSVGDERVVSLSAMASTHISTDQHEMMSEAQPAQDVTMVLMNIGGKMLSDGVTECAFIVGQKDVLSNAGIINSSSSAGLGGWDGSCRRVWCNSVYYNAIPSTLRPIFKQHQNATALSGDTPVTSTDYFALPAEKEVLGSNSGASDTAEASLTQFEYYEELTNRFKKKSGTNCAWWLRSLAAYSTTSFVDVTTTGLTSTQVGYSALYISPFGVI